MYKNYMPTHNPTIDVVVKKTDVAVDVKFEGTSVYPHYKGEYVITPKAFQNTTLETKNTILDDNVKVDEIPYQLVANPSGGKTATIA